ncbi:tyrosine-type recombinase/integrase [Novosphingobium album (ex Hu et al. 2023)]|uniref:Tyrosine-type recombinase/integrase n=1 Tax=Novosphingobium album (ex Hu et al. 2023) TaxID=2930093 RepID=A0ABT0B731_9SPHN|nr:tyrosine-type recombinase/integrase [Novosphingobium album (ex Hu et al. 2023)]MCJ2180823.1 tyrosine-type recombinase/integrase [Novosphingobium album (ex Hu et al. 2023)]
MNGGPRILKVARKGKNLRWYIYAWRDGPQVRVAEQPSRPRLTPADIARIAELQAADRTLPTSTCAGAIMAFKRSKYWRDLAPSTQKTWGIALDRIEAKWEQVPMRVLGDARMKPKVVTWRDGIAETNARGADIAVMVLSMFLEWCALQGLCIGNPAAGIPTVYRRKDRAPVVWLPEDIEAIRKVAQQPLCDAIALAELTGLRRADLVTLRWDEVGDLAITRMTAKKSRGKRYRVSLPRLPELDALLVDLKSRPRKEGVETVLVNQHGNSWAKSGDGLNSSFDDARAKANDGAGIYYVERDPVTGEEIRLAKRLHDLRGTFATRLMTHPTARLTDREIADLMGWSEEQVGEIRKRYVDDAAIVVALGRRLSGKRTGKRRA